MRAPLLAMSNFQNKILTIEQIFHHFIKWVLFIITGAMTTCVLLGVLFRYVLKAPLPWSEEMARYLMIWGVSLGASIAFREGSHVGVTILMDRLNRILWKILIRFAQIIVIAFMATISIHGFILVSKLRGQTSPAMEIPMAWPYLAIPVGCCLIFLEALAMFIFKINMPEEDKG
ncbi:MAG: TRAP transporter small permease [Thermodesulfobacteriota bacterium]|nr:TRAP transporter small permease [Thermodesulfobacteriota bacterium]